MGRYVSSCSCCWRGYCHAKSEFPSATHNEIELIIKETASDYAITAENEENSCLEGRCGDGVLNASEFLKGIREYMGGDKSYIKHSLSLGTSCDEKVYSEYFGELLSLCDAFEVSFDSEAITDENVIYELYEIERGLLFDIANGTMIFESNNPKGIISGIDADKSFYGYRVCTDGVCDNSIQRINSSRAIKPDSCK